jgi:hypothetical protein
MKVYHMILECGHIGYTFEPDAFVWANTFYCEDCKDRKNIVIMKSNNLESK